MAEFSDGDGENLIFHKKIRTSRGGQEKSKRKNSEGTTGVNAIPSG
jgi:hypothetical protein